MDVIRTMQQFYSPLDVLYCFIPWWPSFGSQSIENTSFQTFQTDYVQWKTKKEFRREYIGALIYVQSFVRYEC